MWQKPVIRNLCCHAGGSLVPFGLPKEFDLIYSNQGGEWNDYARNWTLAKASFKRLITELGIKVVPLVFVKNSSFNLWYMECVCSTNVRHAKRGALCELTLQCAL